MVAIRLNDVVIVVIREEASCDQGHAAIGEGWRATKGIHRLQKRKRGRKPLAPPPVPRRQEEDITLIQVLKRRENRF